MRQSIGYLTLFAALHAAPAAAQYDRDYPPPRVSLGGSLQLGQAVGQFANYVDFGGGAGGYFLFRPDPRGPLGFRFHVMYVVYGSQTHRYPLVPGIAVDVTTRNQIAEFSLGPQLTFGRGPVQVYGFGGIGGSFFATVSSVEGSDQSNQPFASSTNYHDGTFASELGGGMLIQVARRRLPVFVDLGARYLNNGRVTYVTKEGVSVSGNQLVVNPVDSKANLVVYHLGVLIGLRRPERP